MDLTNLHVPMIARKWYVSTPAHNKEKIRKIREDYKTMKNVIIKHHQLMHIYSCVLTVILRDIVRTCLAKAQSDVFMLYVRNISAILEGQW